MTKNNVIKNAFTIMIATVIISMSCNFASAATYDATGTWLINYLNWSTSCSDDPIPDANSEITQDGDTFTITNPFGTLFTGGTISGANYTLFIDGTEFHETLSFTLTSSTTFTGTYVYDGDSCHSSAGLSGTKVGSGVGGRPAKPTLIFPLNGATGVSLTPILQTGNFSDPDTEETHVQTQWQVSSLSDFSNTLLSDSFTDHLISLTLPSLTLDEGTTYYWRVRFQDSSGNWSDWSDPFWFTTLTTTNDLNENGIPDNQENNTVDLDGDGIPDSQQDHIKSLNTVIGNGQMGVSIKNAPNVTSIKSIESIDPSTISQTARPYSMALGLFALSLNVTNAGDTVQVTVYFSQAAPMNATWFIYDPINDWQNYSDHATFRTDRMSVLLDLQDGGIGDADGTANGVIVDPGGFGLASWIEGSVLDAATGEGVSSAEIKILDLVIKTLSDGRYLSMILPGTYSSIVSAGGYQPISRTIQIPEGDIATYDFSMPACGLGSKKIYLPHIASDGTWETEIGIINTGTQSLSGALKAYSNSGQEVASSCISLSSNARREIIVGNEFSNARQIGYIVLGSDSPNLKAYLKFYINGKFRVAIPAASQVNTEDIYISHIASDATWTTGISILNTNSSSKLLTIEFDNGTIERVELAGNEHQAFTIRDLFDGNPQSDINSAVIKNGSGIVGLEIFGTTASSGLSFLSGILLKDDTTFKLYYPHVTSDGLWSTGIVAYNPSTLSRNLTITPYSSSGDSLSTQKITIGGKEKYIGTPERLSLPVETAWFQIEAPAPITGFELFSTTDGKLLGGYTGVGINRTDGVFAKIVKEGGTGIAFVNIENSSATVTMTAYDDNGNTIATETINLTAHQKVVNVPSELFSEDIRTATYIGYTSTREIVGFQLNISSDGMMLDALPGM